MTLYLVVLDVVSVPQLSSLFLWPYRRTTTCVGVTFVTWPTMISVDVRNEENGTRSSLGECSAGSVKHARIPMVFWCEASKNKQRATWKGIHTGKQWRLCVHRTNFKVVLCVNEGDVHCFQFFETVSHSDTRKATSDDNCARFRRRAMHEHCRRRSRPWGGRVTRHLCDLAHTPTHWDSNRQKNKKSVKQKKKKKKGGWCGACI